MRIRNLQVLAVIQQSRMYSKGGISKVKLDRVNWDRMAEEAALVSALATEVQNVLPIERDTLWASWQQCYIDGDQAVLVEVQSCIMNNKSGNLRDISTLNQLLQQHAASCPVPAAATVSMQQLERDSFDLVMRQLQYDLQVLRVTRQKRASWAANVYHVKLSHTMARHGESVKAATWFMSNYVKLVVSEKSDEMLREFQMHRQQVIQRLRLDQDSCVTCQGLFGLIFVSPGYAKIINLNEYGLIGLGSGMTL